MERLGMVRDATSDFEHPNVPIGHHLRHHIFYRFPTVAELVRQPKRGRQVQPIPAIVTTRDNSRQGCRRLDLPSKGTHVFSLQSIVARPFDENPYSIG